MSSFEPLSPYENDDPLTNIPFDQEGIEPDEGINWMDWHDPISAPLRGVEGFIHGIYNTADAVLGTVGAGDVLPDWDERKFGRSESLIGGFGEVMTQFLMAFIPIAGVMSRGSQFGGVTRGILSQGVKGKGAIKGLSVPGAQKLRTFAGKNLRKEQVSLGQKLSTSIPAGFVADFSVFDPHEARLSNLLRSHAGLQDPVTEFLAAKEDDPQMLGRLKGAIEGMGMGAFADSFIHALGRIKKWRNAKAEGKTADEAVAADEAAHEEGLIEGAVKRDQDADEAAGVAGTPVDQLPDELAAVKVDDSVTVSVKFAKKLNAVQKKINKARVRQTTAETPKEKAKADVELDKLQKEKDAIVERDQLERDAAAEVVDVPKEDFVKVEGENTWEIVVEGETYRIRYVDEIEVTDAKGVPRMKAIHRWVDHDTGEYLTSKDQKRGKAVAVRVLRERRRQALDAEGLRDADAQGRDVPEAPAEVKPEFQVLPMQPARKVLAEVIENLKRERDAAGNPIDPQKIDPHLVVTRTLRALGDEKTGGLNLSRMDADQQDVVNAVADLVDEAWAPDIGHQSFDEMQERAITAVMELLDVTDGNIPLALRKDIDLAGAAEKYRAKGEMDLAARRKFSSKVIAWRIMLESDSREVLSLGKAAFDATEEGRERALANLAVGVARITVSHKVVQGFAAMSGRDLVAHKIPFGGGMERVQEFLKSTGGYDDLMTLAKQLNEAGDDAVFASKLLVRARESVTFFKLTQEWWINALLGGGRTLNVNFISGAMMAIWRPFEKMVGSLLAGNTPGVREAMLEYTTYAERWHLATKFGWESMRTSNPILLAGGKVDEFGRSKAMTAQGVKEAMGKFGAEFDPNAGYGRVIDRLGSFFRYPTAVLTGTDEMIKVTNFYAHAESVVRRLYSEGALTVNGQRANPEEIVGLASKRVSDMVYRGQAINEEVLYRKFFEEAKAKERAQPGSYESVIDMQAEGMRKANEQWTANKPESVLERLVIEDASRVAEETTFTRNIPQEGTFAESITAATQSVVRAHPVLRYFAPFIRTPANILFWARDRTVDPVFGMARQLVSKEIRGVIREGAGPGGMTGRQFIETNKIRNRYLRDMMGDMDLQGLDPNSSGAQVFLKQKREEAIGRVAVGMSISAAFFAVAAKGGITGRGPSDKEQRDIMLASGWRPYSLKIGDSYVEYRRLDPFATILGTIADLVTIGQYAPDTDQSMLEDSFNALIISFANNTTNKTYMTGLKNLTSLISNPGEEFPKIWPRFAKSFIPTGPAEGVQFLAGDHDPIMREVRGWTQAMMEKAIPYYGQSLDPVRNVLGEPVRRIKSAGYDSLGEITNLFIPIAYGEVSDDVVRNELSNLEHSFTPPSTQQAGVELRDFKNDKGQSSYDRMLEIRKDKEIGGKTLRRALREMIHSDYYQAMDPASTLEFRSPRIDAINSLIQRYHRASTYQVREEFPELADEIQRIREERATAVYSGLEVIR